MRQYISYTNKYVRENIFEGPQSMMNHQWGHLFIFRETWANGNHLENVDRRYIGVIDYDEGQEELINKAVNGDGAAFSMTLVDNDWVISHLNKWYGEGEWSFDDNNIFKLLNEEEI